MAFRVPEYIQTLVPYAPGKPIEETQRELGISNVIKMASNENPWGPSPVVLEAIRKMDMDIHRYPDGSGFKLKKNLAQYLGVERSQLILGNGSNEIIDMIIRTYCQMGDAIVTSQFAFIAYRICAQVHGVRTLEAPVTHKLKFDLKKILTLVAECDRARVVFIANPNNPTGTYLDRTQLENFLKEVSTLRDGSVLVVLDYAYWEYRTADDMPDPLGLMEKFPNVIALRTFSKVYGLAGLRVGYGVASPEMISTIERVRQPFNLNSLGTAAASFALDDQGFVEKVVKENTIGVRFWERNLDSLKVPYWPSQGNFLLIDVERGLGKTGKEVYHSCLKKGVIFRPLDNYGLTGALRVSIGKPEENEQAYQVLKELGSDRREEPQKSVGKSEK